MSDLSPIMSRPSLQSQRSNHSSSGLHVKWSTPLTNIKVIPARELFSKPSSLNTQSSEAGTIAGAMSGLNLMPSSSVTDHQPPPPSMPCYPASMLSAVHPSLWAIAQSNPNLRHIAARFQTRLPEPQYTFSNVTDEDPVADDVTTLHNAESPSDLEALHQQPDSPASSPTPVVTSGTGTTIPPLSLSTDVIDLTRDSDDETYEVQKSKNNHKHKKIPRAPLTNLNVKNSAKRAFDVESSDSPESPRKSRKTRVTIAERQASSRPGVAVGVSNALNLRGQSKSTGAAATTAGATAGVGVGAAAGAAATGVVATSSKVTVEQLEDGEAASVETGRAYVYSSMVSRKVRWWAHKLREIPRAQLDSLFVEEITPVPAGETLGLLKDIDEHKSWVTRVEVEDARLEWLLVALVNQHLEAGSDAYKVAVRILDNFAQRFRGERYYGRV